jgi:hypothetical protein
MRGWDRSPTAIGGTRICKRKVRTSSADMVNRFRGLRGGVVFKVFGEGKMEERGRKSEKPSTKIHRGRRRWRGRLLNVDWSGSMGSMLGLVQYRGVVL